MSDALSLRDLQALIAKMYSRKDEARGVDGTFMWLMEEVGELAAALRGDDQVALAKEFADVLACVKEGAGISLVPQSIAAAFIQRGQVRQVRVDEPWAQRQQCIEFGINGEVEVRHCLLRFHQTTRNRLAHAIVRDFFIAASREEFLHCIIAACRRLGGRRWSRCCHSRCCCSLG